MEETDEEVEVMKEILEEEDPPEIDQDQDQVQEVNQQETEIKEEESQDLIQVIEDANPLVLTETEKIEELASH